VEVGCWAHARRKFHEARTSDPERSHAAIAWIGRLYGVEREARDEGWDDARLLAARRERSLPLLESFGAWLEGEAKKVLPKSPVGEAIAYAESNWIALTRYLESPYLSIDNNATENAIRPIGLGRKNWLHLGSDRGNAAQSGAELQESRERTVHIPARRARPREHTPGQPDQRSAAGPSRVAEGRPCR
jgi:transposase